MSSVTKSVVFDSVRDADLLAWLEEQGPRGQSALIREALRTLREQKRTGLSPADIEQIQRACRQAVRRELEGRLVVGGQIPEEGPAPLAPDSEAARNLARIEEEFEKWD